MLAMVVNDNEGSLTPRGVFGFFASKLAPTKAENPNARRQKARIKRAFCVVTWRSVFQVTEYGAADGTRTRDPRRDRPVF